MNVALVYDRINSWGGAERVLLSLHKLYPDAPLFTAVYQPESSAWASVFRVRPSFLNRIPFARSNHEWFAWATPLAFEQFDFSGFDLVISITSAEAKSVATKPGTVHICYMLTPTRYLWSHYHEYFRNPLVKGLTLPFVSYLREVDQIAANRPDAYIAISDHVAKRIRKYYRRESEVVYPPAGFTEPLICVEPKTPPPDGFFLIVSRLVHYKKIDFAINVFNKMNIPLVIIGKGRDENRLRSIAGRTVYFRSNLTDNELCWYYRQCRSVILPQEEDFGLVSVEAQQFGKPVIVYDKSGARETVIDKTTGFYFSEYTHDALADALEKTEKNRWNEQVIKHNGARFSEEKFQASWKKAVQRIQDTVRRVSLMKTNHIVFERRQTPDGVYRY